MCEPLTIAAIIAATASAGSAVASYSSGQAMIQATQDAANNDLALQLFQMNSQDTEVEKQAANDMNERSKAAQIEQGKLRVIAGESGTLGITSDLLLLDSEFQEGTDIATINANKVSALKQSDMNKLSAYSNAQNTVNLARNKAPTLVGTGLQIASGLSTAYIGSQGKTK